MIIGVIPARIGSTRLADKPLIDLEGQTMIERVWRAASESTMLNRLVIATDSELIASEARRIGAECVITGQEIPTGTDRCLAAVNALGLSPDVVVNIQGDEPLLEHSILDSCISALESHNADVATPVTRLTSVEELLDDGCVKVAMASSGRALYFSRSPIPHLREVEIELWPEHGGYWKHLGIYAFTAQALKRHVLLPPSLLETSERLEQLRLLEDGAHFVCVETAVQLVSIDVEADAERVRNILRTRNSSK